MKLIDNWKKAWTFSSVQVAALLSILALLQTSLPDLQAMLEPQVYAVINLVLGVLVILARVVKQSLEEKDGSN